MNPSSVSELEDHLGYWLRLVSNHVSAEFERALQARHISVAEWVTLRHLYQQQDRTPGELVPLLGMTRGAVSKVLDKLEQKGWMTACIKPEDHRVRLLCLTPEGTRLVPELAQIADRNDNQYFDCLEEAEQANLKSLLQKLALVHHWKNAPVD